MMRRTLISAQKEAGSAHNYKYSPAQPRRGKAGRADLPHSLQRRFANSMTSRTLACRKRRDGLPLPLLYRAECRFRTISLVSQTEDAFVDTRGNIDITYKQWACSSFATQGRVNLHRRPI